MQLWMWNCNFVDGWFHPRMSRKQCHCTHPRCLFAWLATTPASHVATWMSLPENTGVFSCRPIEKAAKPWSEHVLESLAHAFRSAQQTLLHTDPFTHRPFYYTQTLVHTNDFPYRHVDAKTLLRNNAFTHRPFHTQTLLHTDTFTQKRFYTQKLLHTEAFYTQTLLHVRLPSSLAPRYSLHPQFTYQSLSTGQNMDEYGITPVVKQWWSTHLFENSSA